MNNTSKYNKYGAIQLQKDEITAYNYSLSNLFYSMKITKFSKSGEAVIKFSQDMID